MNEGKERVWKRDGESKKKTTTTRRRRKPHTHVLQSNCMLRTHVMCVYPFNVLLRLYIECDTHHQPL